MITLVFIFILCLIFIPEFMKKPGTDSYVRSQNMEQRRMALNAARIFLAPYDDIWRNLRLSNKYCSLILEKDGVTIRCIEKVKPYRKLQIISSPIHTIEELWNMFCVYFCYNKSYDGIKEDCFRYRAQIIETMAENENNSTRQNTGATKFSDTKPVPDTLKEKLDINNCSEIELTELPGISIVIAKKAIKRREEIGGFKSVDEFLNFIKLKPHMENQLRKLVKVEKMKGSLHQKRYKERSVDF